MKLAGLTTQQYPQRLKSIDNDRFSRPLPDYLQLASDPSNELLGYFHSSAIADFFCKSKRKVFPYSGGQANNAFEGSRKLTLVCETGGQSDLCEWGIRY